MTEASKRLWTRNVRFILDADGIFVCECVGGSTIDIDNAALIVKCVNAHDALVEACKSALDFIEDEYPASSMILTLRAALALAEVK